MERGTSDPHQGPLCNVMFPVCSVEAETGETSLGLAPLPESWVCTSQPYTL